MGFLATLTWSRTAATVHGALTAARATDGPIVVVGPVGLARVLADRGLDVASSPAEQPLASVVIRTGEEPSADLLRALRPGGAVVLIAPPPAAEQSRRALCAGLVDLEQRRAGRLVVTSGRKSAG